jgi:hypothetical protein
MDSSSLDVLLLSLGHEHSSRAGWFWTEPDERSYTEHDEKRQYNELGEFEWSFGLRWRHRMQERHLFKRLHNQNEKIEIQTDHGADRIDPAPCAEAGHGGRHRGDEKPLRPAVETLAGEQSK